MANSAPVSQFQQQFQCKDCGLVLNSAESLDVHHQYHHKETLLQQWSGTKASSATTASSHSGDEKNNNMTKVTIKRECPVNNISDNSEVHKRSPDYHRTTPENGFTQPPTPQSYHSGSSEYQNSAFSPNFQHFPVKSEGNSPVGPPQPHFQNAFGNFADQQQQFFNMQEAANNYSQDIGMPGHGGQNNLRYHPYGFDRPKSQCGVQSASPAYPPQPTPSPSPKQCDKCGYVCESGAQLIEHTNLNHPNHQVQQPEQYHGGQQHYIFNQVTIKEEECSQSEILDLDSQKVVHPVWHNGKEDDKRPDNAPTTHSVSNIITWPPEHHQAQQQQQPQAQLFQNEQSMYMSDQAEHKIYSNISEAKMFSSTKLFQPHPLGTHNFLNNPVPPASAELNQNYRAFEHIPASVNAVVSNNQVPNVPQTATAPATSSTKSSNWKSNEARRPKTYNCSACNKWFTSSGHLKRHYNTTLHKNAVKASGLPDPASLPISAHHHPTRDSATSKDDHRSGSPREDPRVDDNSLSAPFDNRMAGLSGVGLPVSYDRPGGGPGMHHGPPGHSPLGQHHGNHGAMMQGGGAVVAPFPGHTNGGSPNGEAGLSSPDSRGLLSMTPGTHGFNTMPPQSHVLPAAAMEGQFQIYPNECAPHVTQVTAITSSSTIGELQFAQNDTQPLPSFAQLQTHRLSNGFANVGGSGSVTIPIANFYTDDNFGDAKALILKEDHKPLILSNGDIYHHQSGGQIQVQMVQYCESPSQYSPETLPQYSPTSINNNHQTSQSFYAMQMSQQLSINPDAQSESKENINGGSQSSPTSSSPGTGKDDKKSRCFDCDKVFNRPCYLTQHNKTCHNGEKPFRCARCGKRYATENIFEEHMKKHMGNKPYKCDDCPKEFNHKTDLRRHKCSHTGQKPYACSICNKGFIRKDHMVKHMETHARKKEKLSAIRN